MAAQSLFVGSGWSFVGRADVVAFGSVTGALGVLAWQPVKKKRDKDRVSCAVAVFTVRSCLNEGTASRKVTLCP